MVYSVVPCDGTGRIWNTVCGAAAAAPPAPPAAPPVSGAIQRVKPAVNSGTKARPRSPQVRAASMSPRRTDSGPMVVLANLAMAPSGPKIWPISAALASILALAANGYFSASVWLNGW